MGEHVLLGRAYAHAQQDFMAPSASSLTATVIQIAMAMARAPPLIVCARATSTGVASHVGHLRVQIHFYRVDRQTERVWRHWERLHVIVGLNLKAQRARRNARFVSTKGHAIAILSVIA